MNQEPYFIPIWNLSLMLIPLIIVIGIYFRWSLKGSSLIYATVRMLVQLGLVGFVLKYIFRLDNSLLICAILLLMLSLSGWIALDVIKSSRRLLYRSAFIALFVGCIPTLALVIFGVIKSDPWYNPTYLIPIAGMNFSNALIALSLAAERFQNESARNIPYEKARSTAFKASLIPNVNMFLVVGLVSFPGMMTGQILSGVDPLIAVRYQIMIMLMAMGSSGIASAFYLFLNRYKPTLET
jgi:putative ABC transport system permease protein